MKLFSIGLLLVVLLASFAVADISFTDTKVTVEADYANFNEDDKFIVEATNSFTINNNAANNVSVVVSVEDLPSKYKLKTTKTVQIPANGSVPVVLDIEIPHDKDPGEEKIGVVKATVGNEVKSVDLIQNTLNMLVLKEIKVDYIDDDGKDRDDDFDSEKEGDDSFSLEHQVKIGTELKFVFEIENLFDDKDYDDGQIDDIELTIDADDSDIFPNDFEDKYDLNSLDPKEDGSLTVSWTPQDDANEQEYEVEITLEGKDDKSVKYKVVKTVNIDLSRIRDDIRVLDSSLSPSTVTNCQDTTVTLDVELQNYGTIDQDNVAFSAHSDALDFNENIQDLEIKEFDDDDDSWKESYSFVVPKGLKADKYRIDLTAYIDNDEEVDTKFVNLIVSQCAGVIPETPKEEPKEEVNDSTKVVTDTLDALGSDESDNDSANVDGSVEQVGSGKIFKTVEDPYTTDDFMIASLVIGIVLVLAIMILFIVVLLRK